MSADSPATPATPATPADSPALFIGSDHRGFELKTRLISDLAASKPNYKITDLGPKNYDPADDYNDAAIAVSKAVVGNPNARGILICGSGNGVAIQANRKKGIRAIAPIIPDLARLGREHNDANVLCLSADFLDYNKVVELSNIFLNTNFSGEERHTRRNHRLDEEV